MLDGTTIEIDQGNLAEVTQTHLAPMGVARFAFEDTASPRVILRSVPMPSGSIVLNSFSSTGHQFVVEHLPFATLDFPLQGRLEKSVDQIELSAGVSGAAVCVPGRIDAKVTSDAGKTPAGVHLFIEEHSIEAILNDAGLTRTGSESVDLALTASDALRSLRGLMVYAYEEVFSRGTPRLSLGRARLAEALIVDHLGEVFEIAGLAATRSKRDSGQQRLVHACEDIIRTRFGEPLTVSTIASELGVSERRIQSGFRSIKGISPSLYLSKIRLEAARRMLVSARGDETVTSIALECGIFHHGRFAQRYRALFGEMPSQTLSAAKRRD